MSKHQRRAKGNHPAVSTRAYALTGAADIPRNGRVRVEFAHMQSTGKAVKRLIIVTALTLICGSAVAQNTGPTPQTGMEKPGITSGAKPDGKMDASGMSAAKGNVKREQDGAPASPPREEKK